MLGARWYKVLNDLWGNRTRTAVIVLSIAVGLFAVGTIVSARVILTVDLARGYAAINPSSGIIRTAEPFDEGFIHSVRGMDGVAAVDARRAMEVRIQAGLGEWMSIKLFAVADYETMQIDVIRSTSGSWPPPDRELLVERAAIGLIDANVGDSVLIELPNGRQRQLRIAGLAHDMVQVPAQFDGSPYGYISFKTLEWFGEPYGFNELHIVATDASNAARALAAVNRVKHRLERNGFTLPLTLAPQPGQLPLDDIMQAVLILLGLLGVLALFLSVFLIINTVSALLAQQQRQIGVMKAIGARTIQIVGMLVVMVVIYGLLALILAAPLSVIGAREISRFVAQQFNFDLLSANFSTETFALQAAIAIIVPVAASILPILASLRVTASEALSGYRPACSRFGAGIIDRALSGANLWFARNVLRRPLLLALRNTFRSKGRLVLTLTTLTLAGAIFIGVFSARTSLMHAIDDLLSWWRFDTVITLARPYRTARVTQIARAVPGVVETDIWFQIPVSRVRDDGSESGAIFLFAPHADSRLVRPPRIIEGRWLLPEDDNALVINAIMQAEEPDIDVGDEIVLKVAGRERMYRVVGVCLGIMVPMSYAGYPNIAEATGNIGCTGAALVRTQSHAVEDVARTTAALETRFKQLGLQVSDVQTIAQERAELAANFDIVIGLLLVMAILLAIVGGLGLMGTMSINVIERTREIGVLRAIGAPSWSVAWVFVLEGVTTGLLSWILAVACSIPLGRLLTSAVGMPLMGTPVDFKFSIAGVWLWLAVVATLSTVASALPARRASRLTVREVLAYE